MKLCLFEDGEYEELYPLAYTRPVWELRCGYFSLKERALRLLAPSKTVGILRDWISPLFARKTKEIFNKMEELKGDDFFFLNPRYLPLPEEFSSPREEVVGTFEGKVVYVWIRKETLERISFKDFPALLEELKNLLPQKEVKGIFIRYLWDLVNYNAQLMKEDFELVGKRGMEGEFSSHSVVYGDKDLVFVAPSAKVHPMVVLDTTQGPVFIDEEAEVFPQTRIEGPSYIGRGTQIVGAKIREGSSLGPMCRIGDEVEETIIQGYTNKYHNGFLGHSYIGEWVNLGAGTNNSDLKNTYGTVKVWVKGREIDSGERKVGCFIGDHTKTGIGTLINTGTVMGVAVNFFGGGVTPKFLPSFVWGGKDGFVEYRLKKVVEIGKIVMGRRKVEQTPEERELLKKIYQLTREEREKFLLTWERR